MSLGIRSIPTLIVFRNGQPVEQIVGAMPRRSSSGGWTAPWK